MSVLVLPEEELLRFRFKEVMLAQLPSSLFTSLYCLIVVLYN